MKVEVNHPRCPPAYSPKLVKEEIRRQVSEILKSANPIRIPKNMLDENNSIMIDFELTKTITVNLEIKL